MKLYPILIGIISFFFSITIALAISTAYTQNNPTFPGMELSVVNSQWRNEWTPELETEFQARATTIINHFANPQQYGNGYGENEKRSYPRAMFDFLAGNRQKALEFLQKDDPQAKDHAHTEGIDYYFCFTLKGQIRKYFLFKQFFDPAYTQRMYQGAKQWTQKDPLTRPHPEYGFGEEEGGGWSIKRRGRWVDGRNTDNLRAMRETAVYLMAEETGNEETRQIYKKKIRRYVEALYNIGMGEWDSPVYHGHTFAPYLNLYDFAQDPEVKDLAKAALDWMSIAAGLKYYRGGWGSPSKRDYGGSNVVFGADAARAFWLYYGNTVIPNPNPSLDTLHFITSTYRPPLAAVAIAKKQFLKPLEIIATKPVYENWKPGNDRSPGYWETQFFGHSYQMGSLAGTFADGDVEPFVLMADNSRRGVDYFAVNTGSDRVNPGKNPGDQIGQYENLLIWLRPADNYNFAFQIPQTANLEIENNIWFIQLEKTWLAIFPINLNEYELQNITDKKWLQRYKEEQVFTATTQGNDYSGFALEVGEIETEGNYAEFKRKIKEKSRLEIQQDKITFQGSNNQTFQLTYNQQHLLPILARDGKNFNWLDYFAIYNSQTPDKTPIYLGWKQGKLTVKTEADKFVVRNVEAWK